MCCIVISSVLKHYFQREEQVGQTNEVKEACNMQEVNEAYKAEDAPETYRAHEAPAQCVKSSNNCWGEETLWWVKQPVIYAVRGRLF